MAQLLTKEGYDVITVGDGAAAIEVLESKGFYLIISDSIMPHNGFEVVTTAKRIDPQCPVIVISGYPSVESRISLIDHPRVEYIPKPFDVEHLRRTVAKFLEA